MPVFGIFVAMSMLKRNDAVADNRHSSVMLQCTLCTDSYLVMLGDIVLWDMDVWLSGFE